MPRARTVNEWCAKKRAEHGMRNGWKIYLRRHTQKMRQINTTLATRTRKFCVWHVDGAVHCLQNSNKLAGLSNIGFVHYPTIQMGTINCLLLGSKSSRSWFCLLERPPWTLSTLFVRCKLTSSTTVTKPLQTVRSSYHRELDVDVLLISRSERTRNHVRREWTWFHTFYKNTELPHHAWNQSWSWKMSVRILTALRWDPECAMTLVIVGIQNANTWCMYVFSSPGARKYAQLLSACIITTFCHRRDDDLSELSRCFRHCFDALCCPPEWIPT